MCPPTAPPHAPNAKYDDTHGAEQECQVVKHEHERPAKLERGVAQEPSESTARAIPLLVFGGHGALGEEAWPNPDGEARC